jgi:hypothetical protein
MIVPLFSFRFFTCNTNGISVEQGTFFVPGTSSAMRQYLGAK